jgi:hypothetical protein
MTILVTVRFAQEVDATHPRLREQLGELLRRHGLLSHRRFLGEGRALDLDEWEDESSYRAFIAEARPIIEKLAQLRGISPPTDEIWQPA